MSHALARQRLIALRRHHGWSQEALSAHLGFNDRQTLSEIECGRRALAPEELVRAADAFGVSLDHFTDPLKPGPDEGVFTWEGPAGADGKTTDFSARAGEWLAAFRHVRHLQGRPVRSSVARLALTPQSTPEDAEAEGEALARAWCLGDVPARALPGFLERVLDTLVLHVELPGGLRAGAGQLGAVNAVLIDRREPVAQRALSLASQVFRLLAWSELGRTGRDDKKSERWAQAFARGLLVPRGAVDAAVARRPLPAAVPERLVWIRTLSRHLNVPPSILAQRLVALGVLSRGDAGRLPDAGMRQDPVRASAPLMSRPLMEALAWALDRGHLSVRRTARLVGLTVDGLAALFRAHGMAPGFDL